MGGPQKWGGPVHLHTLHIPKTTTAWKQGWKNYWFLLNYNYNLKFSITITEVQVSVIQLQLQ